MHRFPREASESLMAREELEQQQVEALINELEQKMQRLRALYEQYFMGIERTPPRTARKEVVRLIRRAENVAVRNTAVKFKIRSLVQRFNSYKSYWNRVERQIEEGTYKRDVRRAQRNQKRRDRREKMRDDVMELDVELEDVSLQELQAELEELDQAGAFDSLDEADSGQPAAAQRSAAEQERIKKQRLAELSAQLGIEDDGEANAPPAQKPRQQKGASAARPKRSAAERSKRRQKLSDIKRRLEKRTGKKIGTDREARRVYNQLLEAKKRCNEPTSGLSYESVAKSMKKQREKLQKSRGASNVEFKVVIKDGRAFLKPETK
jgi:hypothetical protein